MKRLGLLAFLVLAACGTQTSSGTAPQASAATPLYRTPTEVAAALGCTPQKPADSGGGGGASAVNFCEIDGTRVQLVTFVNTAGQDAWFELAGQTAPQAGALCVRGELWGACVDPAVNTRAVAEGIAQLGGQVVG